MMFRLVGNVHVMGLLEFSLLKLRYSQQVTIKEPSVNETISILRGLQARYENFHGVTTSNTAILSAATLAERHLATRILPVCY
jgi:ATP-dependent Clp protease ATP-binding subunit ClpA